MDDVQKAGAAVFGTNEMAGIHARAAIGHLPGGSNVSVHGRHAAASCEASPGKGLRTGEGISQG